MALALTGAKMDKIYCLVGGGGGGHTQDCGQLTKGEITVPLSSAGRSKYAAMLVMETI